MDIGTIKFSNEDVVSYLTTLKSYGYLPYITIPSHITGFSMTCIDYISLDSRREKILHILSDLFHCDICDTLPSFISIKHNRACCCKDDRSMAGSYAEKARIPVCKQWWINLE